MIYTVYDSNEEREIFNYIFCLIESGVGARRDSIEYFTGSKNFPAKLFECVYWQFCNLIFLFTYLHSLITLLFVHLIESTVF